LKYVAVLLLRPVSSAAGDDSLVRTGDGRLPADSLVLSTRNIWGIIKSQKDLNLPAHKVRRSSGSRFCGCGMLLLCFDQHGMLACIAACSLQLQESVLPVL
jgi:hypothetical protein